MDIIGFSFWFDDDAQKRVLLSSAMESETGFDRSSRLPAVQERTTSLSKQNMTIGALSPFLAQLAQQYQTADVARNERQEKRRNGYEIYARRTTQNQPRRKKGAKCDLMT